MVVEANSELTIINTNFFKSIANKTDSYKLPMVGISVDGLTKTEFEKRFTIQFGESYPTL